LIISPKSALGAWSRDIEKFDKLDREILAENGTFINYDKVWRGNFENNTFDFIALDEAHYIKNRTSRRAKACHKLGVKAKYRYILSGTPVSNGALEDIFSLFCFLDPYIDRGRVYSGIFKRYLENVVGKEFKGSFYDFQDRYCILNMYHKPSSYIHVKELQEIINEHSYRVKKVDCLDLPEKLPDEIIKVDLAEKTLYKKLATESAILEYEILAENPLSRLVKLRQLASGHLKTEDQLLEVGNNKIPILEEIIEGYPDDKKLVIFAEFKYSIAKISELLRKMKIRFVTLDGDQKDKTIWRKFQSDERIRVIVCQYQTASAGIDLFASDTIIYYEPTLRSNILEQSRDRIHRTGQKEKCSYIHLITKGTVEVDIYRALAGYSDFSEALFTRYMEGYRRSYNV
jgi:SNF2 family DNA or RNA helicase